MVSVRAFSGKKVFSAAFALVALTLSTAAHASNYDYVFSGTAAGNFDGMSLGNTAFTLSFDNINTSALQNDGSGIYSYSGLDGILSADGQTFTLTDVTLEANGTAGIQSVGFYNSDLTNGLTLSLVTPVGYDLTTDLNVPVTGNDLTATLLGGSFTTSAGDTLQFTSGALLGLNAVDPPTPNPGSTPEPSSLLLLTSGLPGLALLRRRFLLA